MRETVIDEETLTLTITGRTGSWLVSGVLGGEDLPLQGMDDRGLTEMLHAMLPARPGAGGAHRRPESSAPASGPGRAPAPELQRRGRHRRAG